MAYNVQFAFFFALAYLNVYRINVKKKKQQPTLTCTHYIRNFNSFVYGNMCVKRYLTVSVLIIFPYCDRVKLLLNYIMYILQLFFHSVYTIT